MPLHGMAFCVLDTAFRWIIFDIYAASLLFNFYYMETVILIVCCVFVGSVNRAGTMETTIWKKSQPGQLVGPSQPN